MAIERCHRNSGFTRIYPNSMVIFPRFVLVYQRVFPIDVPVQNAGFPSKRGGLDAFNQPRYCILDGHFDTLTVHRFDGDTLL
jgi:hypothetical protein